MSTATVDEDAILQRIISHFLTYRQAESDARWFLSILPEDLQGFFQSEVLSAIQAKAGDPAKARKLFLSMGKTSRAIFGPEFARVKKTLDSELRASKPPKVSVNTPEELAACLSEMLSRVDPKTVSEQEKDEIFNEIVKFRKIARQLPEEQRAILDKKIAAYNNSQVKTKPAKKK